jgi:hypothetical protein
MDRAALYLIIVVLLLCAAACTSEPQVIIETVIVQETVEVPVTAEVTRRVEVLLEVTKEVEVTRLVTVEIPVIETRIVEKMVTPTPEPSATPTATPEAQPAAAQQPPPAAAPTGSVSAMMAAGRTLRDLNNAIRGEIHGSGSGSCQTILNIYNTALVLPDFDMSGEAPEVQSAYADYRNGLAAFLDAVDDLADGCQNAIDNQANFQIPSLLWTDTIGKLNHALNLSSRSFESLEALGYQ